MAGPTVVLDDIVLGESTRWHDGRLFFSDWGAGEIIVVTDGKREVVARLAGMPFCFDWLPDGRMISTLGIDQRLITWSPAGSSPAGSSPAGSSPAGSSSAGSSPAGSSSAGSSSAGSSSAGFSSVGSSSAGESTTYADLSGLGVVSPWNDIAVSAGGHTYVNNIGYDFPGGEPRPGFIALVTAAGEVRRVPGDLLFPNGMAVTADDRTLIVAESHAGRLTAFDIGPSGDLTNQRVWAQLDGAAPDGICIDAEGAVWYADVPNQHCRRVREGGEILATVELDRGGFACALSTDGTLYAVTADFSNPEAMLHGLHTGQLIATPVGIGGIR